jgi:hypothetical protein
MHLSPSRTFNYGNLSLFSPNLECLHVPNNRLETLRGLDTFGHIQYLDLKKNSIKTLEGIDPMRMCKFLDISDNKLSSLAGITSFPQLDTFIASRNMIKTINVLKSLSKLAMLDLRQNCIQNLEGLPSKLSPSISTLYLDGNPIVEPVNLIYLRPFSRLEKLSISETPMARKLQGKGLGLARCVELLTNLRLSVLNFQQVQLDMREAVRVREECPLSPDELDDLAFLPLTQLKTPRVQDVLDVYMQENMNGPEQPLPQYPVAPPKPVISSEFASVLEKSKRLTAMSMRNSLIDNGEPRDSLYGSRGAEFYNQRGSTGGQATSTSTPLSLHSLARSAAFPPSTGGAAYSTGLSTSTLNPKLNQLNETYQKYMQYIQYQNMVKNYYNNLAQQQAELSQRERDQYDQQANQDEGDEMTERQPYLLTLTPAEYYRRLLSLNCSEHAYRGRSDRLVNQVIVIQAFWRGWLIRKRLQLKTIMNRAATFIQAIFRGHKTRKRMAPVLKQIHRLLGVVEKKHKAEREDKLKEHHELAEKEKREKELEEKLQKEKLEKEIQEAKLEERIRLEKERAETEAALKLEQNKVTEESGKLIVAAGTPNSNPVDTPQATSQPASSSAANPLEDKLLKLEEQNIKMREKLDQQSELMLNLLASQSLSGMATPAKLLAELKEEIASLKTQQVKGSPEEKSKPQETPKEPKSSSKPVKSPPASQHLRTESNNDRKIKEPATETEEESIAQAIDKHDSEEDHSARVSASPLQKNTPTQYSLLKGNASGRNSQTNSTRGLGSKKPSLPGVVKPLFKDTLGKTSNTNSQKKLPQKKPSGVMSRSELSNVSPKGPTPSHSQVELPGYQVIGGRSAKDSANGSKDSSPARKEVRVDTSKDRQPTVESPSQSVHSIQLPPVNATLEADCVSPIRASGPIDSPTAAQIIESEKYDPESQPIDLKTPKDKESKTPAVQSKGQPIDLKTPKDTKTPKTVKEEAPNLPSKTPKVADPTPKTSTSQAQPPSTEKPSKDQTPKQDMTSPKQQPAPQPKSNQPTPRAQPPATPKAAAEESTTKSQQKGKESKEQTKQTPRSTVEASQVKANPKDSPKNKGTVEAVKPDQVNVQEDDEEEAQQVEHDGTEEQHEQADDQDEEKHEEEDNPIFEEDEEGLDAQIQSKPASPELKPQSLKKDTPKLQPSKDPLTLPLPVTPLVEPKQTKPLITLQKASPEKPTENEQGKTFVLNPEQIEKENADTQDDKSPSPNAKNGKGMEPDATPMTNNIQTDRLAVGGKTDRPMSEFTDASPIHPQSIITATQPTDREGPIIEVAESPENKQNLNNSFQFECPVEDEEEPHEEYEPEEDELMPQPEEKPSHREPMKSGTLPKTLTVVKEVPKSRTPSTKPPIPSFSSRGSTSTLKPATKLNTKPAIPSRTTTKSAIPTSPKKPSALTKSRPANGFTSKDNSFTSSTSKRSVPTKPGTQTVVRMPGTNSLTKIPTPKATLNSPSRNASTLNKAVSPSAVRGTSPKSTVSAQPKTLTSPKPVATSATMRGVGSSTSLRSMVGSLSRPGDSSTRLGSSFRK